MSQKEDDEKLLEGIRNGVVDCGGRSLKDVFAQVNRLLAVNPERRLEVSQRPLVLKFSEPKDDPLTKNKLTHSSDIPLRVVSREEAGLQRRIDKALEVAKSSGGTIEGAHHLAWHIDQMVRALTGDDYERWVAEANDGDEGPETYEWDEGVAP